MTLRIEEGCWGDTAKLYITVHNVQLYIMQASYLNKAVFMYSSLETGFKKADIIDELILFLKLLKCETRFQEMF